MAAQIHSCAALSSAGSWNLSASEFCSLHRSGLPIAWRGRRRGLARRRETIVIAAAANEGEEKKGSKRKGLFGFVTDNASSRGAIQLPNTPAQDGNLGQMISVRGTSSLVQLESLFSSATVTISTKTNSMCISCDLNVISTGTIELGHGIL